MKDGQYIFYVLQHRTVAKSPWLKPKEPLESYREDENWHGSSQDFFGFKYDYDLWNVTGDKGWTSLDEARKQLRIVRERDVKGNFDSYDGYRNHNQAIRHEFRLVKMIVMQHTEIVQE